MPSASPTAGPVTPRVPGSWSVAYWVAAVLIYAAWAPSCPRRCSWASGRACPTCCSSTGCGRSSWARSPAAAGPPRELGRTRPRALPHAGQAGRGGQPPLPAHRLVLARHPHQVGRLRPGLLGNNKLVDDPVQLHRGFPGVGFTHSLFFGVVVGLLVLWLSGKPHVGVLVHPRQLGPRALRHARLGGRDAAVAPHDWHLHFDAGSTWGRRAGAPTPSPTTPRWAGSGTSCGRRGCCGTGGSSPPSTSTVRSTRRTTSGTGWGAARPRR